MKLDLTKFIEEQKTDRKAMSIYLDNDDFNKLTQLKEKYKVSRNKIISAILKSIEV